MPAPQAATVRAGARAPAARQHLEHDIDTHASATLKHHVRLTAPTPEHSFEPTDHSSFNCTPVEAAPLGHTGTTEVRRAPGYNHSTRWCSIWHLLDSRRHCLTNAIPCEPAVGPKHSEPDWPCSVSTHQRSSLWHPPTMHLPPHHTQRRAQPERVATGGSHLSQLAPGRPLNLEPPDPCLLREDPLCYC